MNYYKSPTNEIFAYDADGSQDSTIPSDYVEITDAEAKEIIKQKEDDQFSSLSYAQKRAFEYPSIGDQLDALYKAGVFPDDMAEKIAEVKAKYPKS
jgi:DNA-directed RNA polymerase subunit F